LFSGADGVNHDEIRISLGSLAGARYLRERQPHGAWVVKRGGIGVNLPAPEPDSGMMINVNMPALNVDRWLAAAAEIASPAGSGGSAAAAAASADNGPSMAQYVVPDTIARARCAMSSSASPTSPVPGRPASTRARRSAGSPGTTRRPARAR
jgi:uncharacterized protein YhdP